ncbi:hypothetical protein GQ55_9G568100 [Panicum hallii var. hallii]|uniref:DUF1618 domain-containing protein n=1 Tax=Panicum hallii var. hallii TaxID=1504633 RepID=A0A2T7CFV2_9POAL|nr:hypothetical protein GQ55_9G568100 [Panicum hallii var. hallii]
MPKRRSPETTDEDGDGRSRRPCPRCPPQRHLCVVLDDWSKGCSIYKLDVDGFDGNPDLDLRAERLPGPPIFRLEIPVDDPRYCALFAAAGSMIFAMRYNEEDNDAPVVVCDTATGRLTVGPFTPAELRNRPELVAAGDRLYALDRGFGRDHFKVRAPRGARGWAWSTLRDAPFDTGRATATACHAAHPDGRTMFFSARGRGTFSFDAGARRWAWHGDWMLPFEGQAHYDAEVDAWVGLCRGAASPGRVCSCDVVRRREDHITAERPPPSWKLADEKVARKESVDIELAHMGNGRFCLVEYRNRRGVAGDMLDEDCLLLATTFRLRYDKDGALRAAERRARCYAVHKKLNTFGRRAFGV